MTIPPGPALDQEAPPARTEKDRGFLPMPPYALAKSLDFSIFEKAAAQVLWAHAGADGWCWLMVKTIAAEMRCSMGSARAALTGLQKKGLLRTVEVYTSSSFYRVYPQALVDFLGAARPTESVRPHGSRSPENVRPTESDSPRPTENVRAALPNPVGGSGNPSKLNPSKLTTESPNGDVVVESAAPQRRQRKPKADDPNLKSTLALWEVLNLGHISQSTLGRIRAALRSYSLELVEWGMRDAAAKHAQWPISWIESQVSSEKRRREAPPLPPRAQSPPRGPTARKEPRDYSGAGTPYAGFIKH